MRLGGDTPPPPLAREAVFTCWLLRRAPSSFALSAAHVLPLVLLQRASFRAVSLLESMLHRLNGVQGVAGSNPAVPTV
jgi:hypothetical protein